MTLNCQITLNNVTLHLRTEDNMCQQTWVDLGRGGGGVDWVACPAPFWRGQKRKKG